MWPALVTLFCYWRRDKLVGAVGEAMRLLRLRPHRPPGQRGEAGREVGEVCGDESVKENIAEPMTMAQYLYVVDNPLLY